MTYASKREHASIYRWLFVLLITNDETLIIYHPLTSEKQAAMQHSTNRFVRVMNSSTWLSRPNGIMRRGGDFRLGGILPASMRLTLALESLSMLLLLTDGGVVSHSCTNVQPYLKRAMCSLMLCDQKCLCFSLCYSVEFLESYDDENMRQKPMFLWIQT